MFFVPEKYVKTLRSSNVKSSLILVIPRSFKINKYNMGLILKLIIIYKVNGHITRDYDPKLMFRY